MGFVFTFLDDKSPGKGLTISSTKTLLNLVHSPVEDGVTYRQTYNAENRIASIAKVDGDCSSTTVIEAWSYAYDGDGNRVTTLYDDGSAQTLTRYYFGGAYEETGGAVKKYYSFAGGTVAMRDSDGLKYFLTDHLGSTLAVLDDQGAVLSETRYLPFGAVRTDVGTISQTDFGYTFQRALPDTGLMDYRARFYSPKLAKFIQPDSIIPSPANPKSWNRYAYVGNSPINFSDPSGHMRIQDGKQYDRFSSYKAKQYKPKSRPKPPVVKFTGDTSDGGSGNWMDKTFSFDEALNKQFNEILASCTTYGESCNYTVRMREIYADAGIDLYAFPSDFNGLPKRNRLGEVVDFSEMEYELFINKSTLHNQRFLAELNLDKEYLPNYEHVYFEILKVTYEDQWLKAEDINNYLTDEEKEYYDAYQGVWDEWAGPGSLNE